MLGMVVTATLPRNVILCHCQHHGGEGQLQIYVDVKKGRKFLMWVVIRNRGTSGEGNVTPSFCHITTTTTI